MYNSRIWRWKQVITAVSIFALIWIFFLLIQLINRNEKTAPASSSPPVIVLYTDRDIEFLYTGQDLWWLHKKPSVNCSVGNQFKQCDVTTASNYTKPADGYLFYGSYLRELPLPRSPKTIWGLLQEETPDRRPILTNEEVLNWFNFSCTFSRYSDVPVPLYFLQSLDTITDMNYYVDIINKNMYLTKISPVLYLQSNCKTSTDRDSYIEELMNHISIDSYGKCLNNKKLPKKLSSLSYKTGNHLNHFYDIELLLLIRKYKFVIAIENAVCNDYVTEKFWRAIHLGVVPIYYGSPLIRDWMPNKKSAILIEDYPTPELLSRYLHELLNNDTKYLEHLEHKTKGLVSNRRLFDEIKSRPEQFSMTNSIEILYCLMCERIHEFNTNSSRVNIVNKKHFDCPTPFPLLKRKRGHIPTY